MCSLRFTQNLHVLEQIDMGQPSPGLTFKLSPYPSAGCSIFLVKKHYQMFNTPLHPVPYDASCSKMNLAQRTILGGLTNNSHEFKVINHAFCSSNRDAVS